MSTSVKDLLARRAALHEEIKHETNPRKRMQLCRKSLGLGKHAVKLAAKLTSDQIYDIQETLRLANRVSKGFQNANTSISKLAKARMEKLGINELNIRSYSRPRRVGTDTACLALSDAELEENWFESSVSLTRINEGAFFLLSIGADGINSLVLRILDMDELMLEPSEYKRVVEVSPVFRIEVSSGKLFFGAPENITAGVSIPASNGIYHGTITSLRSGANLKYIATLIQSSKPVEKLYQVPVFQEF